MSKRGYVCRSKLISSSEEGRRWDQHTRQRQTASSWLWWLAYVIRDITATHWKKLKHTATHCSTLQHAATRCNTLQAAEYDDWSMLYVPLRLFQSLPPAWQIEQMIFILKTVSLQGVGAYRNVIPMRWDCGKNPILNSVYLTGSHSIFPSQWPSSQIAMGPQRFNWPGPPPRT